MADQEEESNTSNNNNSAANDDVSSPSKPSADSKIVVHLRPAGDAPVLKQNKFKISEKEKFQTVVDYLRKMLRYKETDRLFLYINSAFQPSPDEIVANLFQCFQLDGKLVINYCTSPAWG